MFLSQPFSMYEPYTHACFQSITQLELPKIQQFCKTINTLSTGIAPQIHCTRSIYDKTHHDIVEKKHLKN